ELASRHPVVTLACWLLLVAAALATAVGGVTGETLFQRLQGDPPSVDGESSRADGLLRGDAPETESVTLLVHGVDPADPGAAALAADLADRLADLDATLAAPFGVPPLPSGEPDPRIAAL